MNKNGQKNNSESWIDEIMNEVNYLETRNNENRYGSSDEFEYLVTRSDNIANDMAIRF
jgi:hypothetical protein